MVSIYNGAGVAIALAFGSLSIFTYLFFGFCPILALWIGLTIVGISMAITPTEPSEEYKELTKILETSLSNIARFIEFLGFKSRAIFIPQGDEVYIVIPEKDINLGSISEDLSRTFVLNREGVVSIVFKSPIDTDIASEDAICTTIREIVVDTLGIADDVKCVDEYPEYVLLFKNIKAGTPGKMVKTIGTIYSCIAASVIAKAKKEPCIVVSESIDLKNVKSTIRVLSHGAELHS